MKSRRIQEEAATDDVGEGLDRDYMMAASGFMPESAVGELPWWAWVVCVVVLAAVVFASVRFG